MFARFALRSLLLLLAPFPSFAADADRLFARFEREFVTGYADGECQFNTRKFASRAHRAGVDLRGAAFLTITGYGDIWYYHGRGGGGTPAEGVWFHHYVLLVPTDGSASTEFDLNRNYAVIDFDFGNEPKPVDLRTYLREMFMPRAIREDERKLEGDFSMGLLKLSASDVSSLVDEIDGAGELSYAAEERASYFRERRFKEFFARIPKL